MLPRLGFGRLRTNLLLLDAARVVRNGTPLALTMPDGTPLRCSVLPDSRESALADLPPLQSLRRWLITLPDGLPLAVNDQLIALGVIYGLVQVERPTSLSIATTAYGYVIGTDPEAVPPSPYGPPALAWNVLVTTYAGAIPKLSHEPAYLEPPGEKDQAAFGGMVRYIGLFRPGADIAAGDALTIDAWGRQVIPPGKTYHIVSADPAGALGAEVIRCQIAERVLR